MTGALTGYSAGVEAKRWLLDFERRVAAGALAHAHERAGVGQHLA